MQSNALLTFLFCVALCACEDDSTPATRLDTFDASSEAADDLGMEVIDCDTHQREGCPCSGSSAPPCCVESGLGLMCLSRLENGRLVERWEEFADCGCIRDEMRCPGYPYYDHCQ